ncbi:MAG: hypothetical protein DMG70_00695, partial [Acidobacteria bacterium]
FGQFIAHDIAHDRASLCGSNLGGGKALISGHPGYHPQPVLDGLAGSTRRGSMLKRCFVGRGMYLESQPAPLNADCHGFDSGNSRMRQPK